MDVRSTNLRDVLDLFGIKSTILFQKWIIFAPWMATSEELNIIEPFLPKQKRLIICKSF